MSLAPVARVALLATLWNPPIDAVAPQGMAWGVVMKNLVVPQ